MLLFLPPRVRAGFSARHNVFMSEQAVCEFIAATAAACLSYTGSNAPVCHFLIQCLRALPSLLFCFWRGTYWATAIDNSDMLKITRTKRGGSDDVSAAGSWAYSSLLSFHDAAAAVSAAVAAMDGFTRSRQSNRRATPCADVQPERIRRNDSDTTLDADRATPALSLSPPSDTSSSLSFCPFPSSVHILRRVAYNISL